MTDVGQEPTPTSSGGPPNEPRHFVRMLAIWLVLSAILDPLFWFLVGPHVPPGTMTSTAESNQLDFNILFVMALPVLLGVWVYLGYSIVMWRDGRKDGPAAWGGEPARGNSSATVAWISITSVVVLFLAGFGTWALINDHGSGGGEGPNPVWTPSSGKILPIQVIAQQWKFTYRYPTFGGFESQQLIVPAGTTVAFHVTSLDVIHSFWAYQLSVKADANPQIDNVAFTTTRGTGTFTVRCSELCGIWHGAMFNDGKVVSQNAFEAWATATEQATAANTKNLPPFAWTYVPDANGSAGGYYPDGTATPYSPSETYGSSKPVS